MRFLALVTLLLVPLAATAADAASIRRVALVVGTNDGGEGRTRLRYAESDATVVLDVLERLGGVAPADAHLVLSPTLDALVAEFDRMKASVAKGPGARRVEFFFYFSGHSDEDGLLLGNERYTYQALRERLDSLSVDVRIAVLDSCASGAMTRRKGGSFQPPFMVDDQSTVKGHAFLTASADDEAAQESDRLGASFFTHYLVSGLRGAADVTGDGRVTLNEAYQFAFNETLARTERTQHGAQHPAYDFQLSGTGDLVMTDLRTSAASLRIAAEVEGRVYVRDARGRLAAELGKHSDRDVDLALAPGDYVITVASEGQVYGARLRLDDGRRTDLTRLLLVNVPTERTVARGGQHVELPEADLLPMNPPGERLEATAAVASNERVPVHLGLVPGIGFPTEPKPLVANLSFGLMPGVDGIDGIGVSVVGHVVGGDHSGVLASAGFNTVGGDASGIVASSGFNIVGGHARGIMSAAGFNVSQSHYGIQAASGFNLVSHDLQGLQAAAGLNVAGSLRGTQVSVLNISGDVSGAQIGVVNIARNVRGAQVGLVNFNDDITGLPLGLLTFSKKGMFHPQVSMGTLSPLNVGLKVGSRRVYTHMALGTPPLGWYGNFGIGVRFPFSAFYVDADVGTGFIDLDRVPEVTLPAGTSGLAYLGAARLMFGWQPLSHLGAFVGASANVIVPPREAVGGAPFGTAASWRPDFFAGVSF